MFIAPSWYRVEKVPTIEPENNHVAFIVQPEASRRPVVPHAPQISSSVSPLLREIDCVDERGQARRTLLPCERSLSIQIGGREIIKLMTLGASPELLVLGFFLNQRLIQHVSDVDSVNVDWQSGVAEVRLHTSSAGLSRDELKPSMGCGLGSALAQLHLQVPRSPVSASTILRVLDVMRQHDAIHRAAGSVHSCALFDGADLLVSIEDVSRHNAVDTITGWMAMHGVSGEDKILFTTGRLTAEMVMKGAYHGVPIMISRNGTTALGRDIAAQCGMSLFGRAASRRFLCYVGAEQLRFDL